MGLDNGIIIKNWRIAEQAIPVRWFETWDKDIRVEVIYMRKWWGVRTDIINYLWSRQDVKDPNLFDYSIRVEDIDNFINIFKKWNDKEQWQDGGSPVWSWKEDKIATQIRNHINNLKKLKKIMKKYPDLEVIFYDSY